MKKMSIFALLLAAVLVTSYSVSGTYAKYTSSATGTDTARVAKWAFNVGTTDIATTNTFTFDLFNTTYTNVESSNSENVIAPGTEGSFTIELTNNSEVKATYAIDYTVDKTTSIPVEFSVDGGNTWTADLADVAATAETTVNANGGAATPITVQWRWVYEIADDDQTLEDEEAENDAVDTALGIDGDDTITVTAVVTATQVD